MFAFERFQWLNACIGVEVYIRHDNTYSCRYCEVSLEKNTLSIGKKELEEGERLDVLKKVPSKKPLAITVSGKGVLIRKASRLENIGQEQLNQLFPNIRSEDFYVQNFTSGAHSYISLIRKELIDDLLEDTKKMGIEVLLISAGPFVSSFILQQLNNYHPKIVFDGHSITTDGEGNWLEYQFDKEAKAMFPLKVGIEPIKEHFVLAYATAFQLALATKLPLMQLPVDSIAKKLSALEEQLKFKFRLSCMLIVFFIALLLNFMVFDTYHSENVVLGSKVSQSTSNSESISKLTQDIARKEQLLKQLGWQKGKRYAWISDQLAVGIPAGITLSMISVNPKNTTESNRLRTEVYDRGKISVKGEAKDVGAVNEWIYVLKSKEWVKDLNLNRFSPAQEGEMQEFEISIAY